jgi:hypothetical protein
MVRSLIAASIAALLFVACGDDDDDGAAAPPPQTQLPSGTVLGQPFTPVEGSALVLGQATCDFDPVQASATGLLLGFGSFQGLCSLVTSSQGCGTKANGTIVTALLVRANVAGGIAPPVVAGSYTVAATIPNPDAQGNVVFAQGLFTRNDATCRETAGTPTATSGTIRIDSITGSRVTGNVDLTFEDGSKVAGAFDVARCGFQIDVCTVLAGGDCTPEEQTCVQ